MKILFFAPDFYPKLGGVAVFLENLCAQLYHREHYINVISCETENSEMVDRHHPYRIYRYPVWNPLSSTPPVALTSLLSFRSRWDIAFLGSFNATHALGLWVAHTILGIPIVMLCHGNDLRYGQSTEVDRRIGSLILKNISLILCNSRFTVKTVQDTGYKGAVDILHPGIDTNIFHPEVDKSEIVRSHGLNGKRVLLTVSRLTEMKNIQGVLAALPAVIKQVPNLLYLVVGNGEDESKLKTLVENMGLQRYVRFVRRVENSQLPAYYCAADLYVMPSCYVKATGDVETFGISFIEASACAKPVIGSYVGGIPDAVVNGVTGLLVDPLDTEGIAKAIIRLLSDKAYARELGMNGRYRVEHEFSWEKVGKELEAKLLGILENSQLSSPQKQVTYVVDQ